MRHLLEMDRDVQVLVATVLGVFAAFAAAVPLWLVRAYQEAGRRQAEWRKLRAEARVSELEQGTGSRPG